MKKLFGNTKITYVKLLILAICSAIITAIFNLIPIFKDTSFKDIAVNLDLWIVFAIFIIVNCESAKEACIKCFLFFLISQPLIYLIEVPFSSEGFGLFRFYKTWFNWTILTIPGSLICYQLKRKNLLSVIVFTPVLIYFGIMFTKYLKTVIHNFPGHLISSMFCIIACLILIYILFEKRIYKLILVGILILSILTSIMLDKGYNREEIILPSATTTYTLDDGSIVEIVKQEDKLIVTSKSNGTAMLELNDNGNIITYYITVTNGNIFISELN